MVSERASQQTFFGISALLFVASAALTRAAAIDGASANSRILFTVATTRSLAISSMFASTSQDQFQRAPTVLDYRAYQRADTRCQENGTTTPIFVRDCCVAPATTTTPSLPEDILAH